MRSKPSGLSMAAPDERASLGIRLLLAVLLSALFAGLALTLLSLPDISEGLKVEVEARMDGSGVSHPVTAVLINFRGYDTLLEMAVLLLVLIGVRSLAPVSHRPLPAPGAVLDRLTRLYTPLMLLVAGYLLWRGADAPGGAFQAGAVLGAAGVLLLLAGWRLPRSLRGWPLRLAIILGLAVFSTVAAILTWHSGELLHYPTDHAGALILLIESAAALSIGITLAALFLGGQPGDDE